MQDQDSQICKAGASPPAARLVLPKGDNTMLHNFARRIRVRWLDHVAMRHLRMMDDRQLADMGASRECLADFIRANSQT